MELPPGRGWRERTTVKAKSLIVTLKIPNRSSRIVCIGVRLNLLGQVVGAPGVGVLTGRLLGN